MQVLPTQLPSRMRTRLTLVLLPAALVALHADASHAAWSQTGGPRGGSVNSLAAIPNGSGGGILFAGQTGIWRTPDNGASWTHFTNGLSDPNTFALFPVPNGSGG